MLGVQSEVRGVQARTGEGECSGEQRRSSPLVVPEQEAAHPLRPHGTAALEGTAQTLEGHRGSVEKQNQDLSTNK